MSPTDGSFFALLTESYLRLVGKPLLPTHRTDDDPRQWLYEAADFCLLAHDTQPDPRFIYANKAAQACFEYTWDEIIGLPSRLSAELAAREARQKLLEQVAGRGYASNYAGIRVSKTGRRFWIEDGTIWQLVDAAGVLQGQAAIFMHWRNA